MGESRTSLNFARCIVFACKQLTSSAAGRGRSQLYCKRHIDHKARHGSHWKGSYKTAELKPYLSAATTFIRPRTLTDKFIVAALAGLSALLEQAPFEAATRLRGLSAKHRAHIALGRLHRANIKADRLLAIHVAILALIEEDPGSHRTNEFRLVQTAKAVHRLASGTHLEWERQDQYGRVGKIELHKYPRSSGRVLRILGELIAKECEWVAERYLADILTLKVKRYGRHPALGAPPTS